MSRERAFVLYFGGAEVPGWRSMLAEEGAHGISLTYMNLRQRMPKRKPWAVVDHVSDDVLVLVDAGAFTANKDPGRMDRDGWLAYAQAYTEFVEANIERIDLVSEFDSLVLGPDYIHEMRETFWDRMPSDKFMPVWHAAYGLEELDRLAEHYSHVAVTDDALKAGPRVSARINNLTQRYDTKFHGAAITKPDVLREVRFASAASTSWLSPIQYGDTIVWDGTRLRRYPKRYKETARKRHRMLFTRAGYDATKIAEGDPNEVARFTIWSWLQFEEQVEHRRGARPFQVAEEGGRATGPPDEGEVGFQDIEGDEVAEPNAPVRAERTERLTLPVFGFEAVATAQGEDAPSTAVPVAHLARGALRRCDNCFVSGSCPAFQPGNECAYDLPLEVSTKEQLSALLRGIIEMQAQRVAFARFAEELEGGYPDPNLSNEMDRLFRLVESLKEIQDTRDLFEVHVKAKAGAGVLSRIFGAKEAAPTHQLPALTPSQTDAVLSDIVDAEMVTEPRHSL